MYRNNHGFTLIEIIAVLVLMSIIGAGVLIRAMNTDQIDLMAQVTKIRNQVRYAQATAMKRHEIWGVRCFGNQYWLFQDTTDNVQALPGEATGMISLANTGVSMFAFTVYFDELGVPWKILNLLKVNPNSQLDITIYNDSTSVTLSVTPETGLIQ